MQTLRPFTTIFACLVLVVSLNGQSFFDGFGVKGGLNVATIHTGGNELFDELSPKTFFHVGIYRDFWLDLDWSLRGELLYSVKGAQTQFQFGTGVEEDSWYRTNYLTIPILAQFATGNFKFGAGPEVGIRLKDQLVIDEEKMPGNLYDQTFDLGIVGNVTYTLLMIDIELRYVYGLTPFTDNTFTNPNGNPGLTNRLHNGVLQFGLGLRIF